MVKVSVIVPVYNMSKYLKKCLDSLVNQTFKDIEIIVINDGSTDNSEEIIKEYEQKYDIIKYYSNTNRGISETRNFGISKAIGKYILFIDSDDYVDITLIEKAYNFAEKNDLDITVWNYYENYEQTKDLKEIILPSFEITNIKENPKLLNEINYSPWNKLYKKNLWNDVLFPKLKYEDLGVLPIIFLKAKRIGKIDECLNYYLIRENSETTTMNEKVFDILKIMDINNRYFKENKYFDLIYDEIEYLNIYHLCIYIIRQRYQKDKDIAKKFINEAYHYLDSNFPNWRKNKYYRNRNMFKKIIETNKCISILYTDIYRSLH